MSEAKVNHNYENDLHVYRRAAESFEERTGLQAFKVETHGNGEEKQLFARMDAALLASELVAQNKALEARLARLESQPTLERAHADGLADAEKRYAEAFGRALFSGNRVMLDKVMQERTSVTTATGATPTIWQDRIVEKINRMNVFRMVCPVRNVTGDQKIVIGGALPTAYKVAEAAPITEDTTYTVANVDVGDIAYGVFVPVSKQYASDAIGGLEYVARKAGEAIANKLEDEYTNGAGGAGNMPGINSYTLTNAGDIGTTLADISGDDLIDLEYSIAPQYRRGNVGYMMSDVAAKNIRKLKGAGNEYLWKSPERYSDIRDGAPSTLNGYPVYINQAMPTTATNRGIVFGNWDFYEIYDRDGGVSVMIDPYTLANSLQTRVIVHHRTYGVCTNEAAFAYLTI